MDENDKTQMRIYINELAPVMGNFSRYDIDRELVIRTRRGKQYRWAILDELIQEGKLEKNGERYSYVNGLSYDEIRWESADKNAYIDLLFPLDLHQYIRIKPRSIIVVAGESGTGKTAFLYDFIFRNMWKHKIWLWSNDMDDEEMAERFNDLALAHNLTMPDPPLFKTYRVDSNFSDAIRHAPDDIHVIDYLDLNSEFYLIGHEINQMDSKLGKGLALVGLQKKQDTTLGLGGISSWKKSKVYITLHKTGIIESGVECELEIQKSRSRTDKAVNPTGMKFGYELIGGTKFRYWGKAV